MPQSGVALENGQSGRVVMTTCIPATTQTNAPKEISYTFKSKFKSKISFDNFKANQKIF